MVVGRKEEAAGILVFEMLEQQLGQFDGERKVCPIPVCLGQFEDRIDEERMVVEVGGEARLAVLEACV